jgi:hypothetical protein
MVFTWAVHKYNVFIFSSVSTFYRYKELWILKKLGKTIIYVFCGTESRPDYLSGNIINALYLKNGQINDIDKCIKKASYKKKTIGYIEKYADYCINHPPCALFHTKPYIKWLYIGFPFSKTGNSLQSVGSNDTIRILHAPSNPQTKGTYIIREIIERIQTEGVPIEYIELIGKPNSKVLEELSRCDFVIDELYSDIPLGGLGVEAAFWGKPTINAGYYGKDIEYDYDESIIPPSIFCMPHEIEEKIRLLISDITLRRQMGRVAQSFVMKNWNTKKVASNYLNLIKGDVPSEWIGDPYSLNYVFGYGQSKDQLKEVVSCILREGGDSGLSLDDKPHLIERLQI